VQLWVAAVAALVLPLVVAGCSSGDDAGTSGAQEQTEAADVDTSGTAGDSDPAQDGAGGGGATLTVGGETYEFDSVLCAVGDQAGAAADSYDFVLTAQQDGLVLRVARGLEDGPFGDEVSISPQQGEDDSWFAPAPVAPSNENPLGEVAPFVEVNGKEVSAEADFLPADSPPDATAEPGTLTATCP
jgi:hypothetical protein